MRFGASTALAVTPRQLEAAAAPAQVPGAATPLLSVQDLAVEFRTARGSVRVVDGLTLSVAPGEVLAIVGESGSGKSVTALSVMRLLPAQSARIVSGRVLLRGRDLLALSGEEMRELRGRDVAMIFQEPMTSLNPIMTIGEQLMEPLRIHLGMSDAQARARAEELLGLVGISDAARRLRAYPHQFSGGMRQRVMIAIGLSCNPSLVIADEPTTALDVTIQSQILALMKDLSQRLGIALIVITHNLGVVARYADRVAVMYAGRLVELGTADQVFHRPRHLYTVGLLKSVPRLDESRRGRLETIEGLPPDPARALAGCRFAPRCPHAIGACERPPVLALTDTGSLSACARASDLAAGLIGWGAAPNAETRPSVCGAVPEKPVAGGIPLLSVRGLTKHFGVSLGFGRPRGIVRAVEDFSIDVGAGETLGLVGESGCGKSTIGRLILQLERPTAGTIRFDGSDVAAARGDELRRLRRKLQVIFQDPYSSLNPRMTIGAIVGEPIEVYRLAPTRATRESRVASLLDQVGLRPELAARYPHQLSGGQRQRVGIARALALEPSFLVCDEAVSALDVSIQGQIMNLLDDLQRQLGLGYLFIAHDLAVVRHIASRVVVMYLGRIMEVADRDTIYAEPLHPYTRALIDAAPVPDPTIEQRRSARPITGELPSPLAPPTGCVFHTRCPLASAECRATLPALRRVHPGHLVACIKA